MASFNDILELAQKNKEKRTREHRGGVYCMLNSDEMYPALISDAEYVEEDSSITMHLNVIKGSSCIERKFTFKVSNGNSARYDAICETLGTDGNPLDLIGKCVYIHLERNGDYQNLRVDAEMDESEFEEMVCEINSKNTRGKKKVNYKKPLSVGAFSKKTSAIKGEDKEDLEEEFLEDEEDYYDEADNQD